MISQADWEVQTATFLVQNDGDSFFKKALMCPRRGDYLIATKFHSYTHMDFPIFFNFLAELFRIFFRR